MTKLVLTSLQQANHTFQFLNPIDDVHAWIKDCEGKFVLVNGRFSARFGFAQETDMVGLRDYDLAPDYLADRYIEDDQQVLEGVVITDRLELIVRTGEKASWFITSKWPIYDPAGNIIGSFGVSRHLNITHSSVIPFRDLDAPIDYIRQHYADVASVAQVATYCNVSVSTLERRFKKHLSKTPHQYINEVRLDHARMMVFETQKNLSQIAQETGFVDNSHFTRVYKARFKRLPSEERRVQRGD